MRDVSDFAAYLAMQNAEIVSELVRQSSGVPAVPQCTHDQDCEVHWGDCSLDEAYETTPDVFDEDIADVLHIEVEDNLLTTEYDV